MTPGELSNFRELMADFGWAKRSIDAMTEALWMAQKRGHMTIGDLAAWSEWQTDGFEWAFYAVVGRPKKQDENAVDFFIPYFATKKVTEDLFIEKMTAMMKAGLEATT